MGIPLSHPQQCPPPHTRCTPLHLPLAKAAMAALSRTGRSHLSSGDRVAWPNEEQYGGKVPTIPTPIPIPIPIPPPPPYTHTFMSIVSIFDH